MESTTPHAQVAVCMLHDKERMLRASGVLLATVKKSTGICGVAVEPNARNVLIGLYQRTLDEIKVGIIQRWPYVGILCRPGYSDIALIAGDSRDGGLQTGS